jgi:hypothetical protein
MRTAAIVVLAALAASPAVAAPRLATSGSFGSGGSNYEWEPVSEVMLNWAQLPEVGGTGVASEVSVSGGLASESADDFLCDTGTPIVAVEWWGVDWTGRNLDYFVIRFYADDPGPPARPGELVYEEECHVFGQESVPGHFDQCHYYLDLPSAFDPDAGSVYWLSIQAVHAKQQWFWLECADDQCWNGVGVVRSEYFGFPDWTTVGDATGTSREFAFGLYSDIASPVESTTWGGVKAMFR